MSGLFKVCRMVCFDVCGIKLSIEGADLIGMLCLYCCGLHTSFATLLLNQVVSQHSQLGVTVLSKAYD